MLLKETCGCFFGGTTGSRPIVKLLFNNWFENAQGKAK